MRYVIVSFALAVLLVVAAVVGVSAQTSYQQFWSNVQMMYDLIVERDVTIQDDLTVVDDTVLSDDVAVGGNVTQAVASGTENVGMLPTVASATITYATTANIFAVATNEKWIVHGVLVNVTSNYDCTGDNCTLQIGDGNDANGLVDLVDAELQAADTEVTGGAAGWQGYLSGTRGAYLADGGGFVYAAADGIDATVGGTDPAAGAATVYIIYTRIQ